MDDSEDGHINCELGEFMFDRGYICPVAAAMVVDLEAEVERLEKLAKDLYVMAQHCPSNMIPSHFDFSTPLEQAKALEGKDGH